MRVGEEGDGWKITTQLNHGRASCSARPAGASGTSATRVRAEWASRPGPDGSPIAAVPDVARAFTQISAYARINELLNWQVASTSEAISMYDAAATKVFSTGRIQTIMRLADDILGRYGDFTDPETAALVDWLDVRAKLQRRHHVQRRRQRGHARRQIATAELGLRGRRANDRPIGETVDTAEIRRGHPHQRCGRQRT